MALLTQDLGVPIIGLLLCEVGNLTDALDRAARQKFERLLVEAFETAGASEHGPPSIIWSQGETVVAFRAEQPVRSLPTLKNMFQVDPWRAIERFEIISATRSGPCHLLLYNSHQPASSARPFPPNMRIRVCKHVLTDAIRHMNANDECIGFAFCGDANCSLSVWSSAIEQTPHLLLTHKMPEFIFGIGRKSGDVMIGTAGKNEALEFFENTCTVPNREQQHDCMNMTWCYRARATAEQDPLPGRQCASKRSWTTRGPDRLPVPEPARPSRTRTEPRPQPTPSEHTPDSGDEEEDASESSRAESVRQGRTRLEPTPQLERQQQVPDHSPEHTPDSGYEEDDMWDEWRAPGHQRGSRSSNSRPRSQHDSPDRSDGDEESAGSQHDSVDWGDGGEEPARSQHDSSDRGDGGEESEVSGEREESHAQQREAVDELQAIGFALAMSATHLPELRARSGTRNCVDMVTQATMSGACTTGEREALEECAFEFFTKLGDRPGRARIHKTPAEIQEQWQMILRRRRLVEPDDRKPINSATVRGKIHNDWMHQFLREELTEQQQRKKHNKKTSIFGAFLRNNAGGKNFVMAVLQAGIPWAPSAEQVATDYNGALEHVATHLARWTRTLAQAVKRHKNKPETSEARRRSGAPHSRHHGLTAEEQANRRERAIARRDYFLTIDLAEQIAAAKGRGKDGASAHAPGNRNSRRRIQPRHFDQMSRNEQWWLQELWQGNLAHRMREAERKCRPVQAPEFRLDEEE